MLALYIASGIKDGSLSNVNAAIHFCTTHRHIRYQSEFRTGDGIFIVNVFDPIPERMSEQTWCYPETVQWERLDEKTGNYVVKKHWGDKIDTVNQVIYPHFAFEVKFPDGRTERIVDDLSLKYYFNHQLRAVVENAGMVITEEYSWYNKTPPGGREIIFICRRKR